MGKSGPAYVMTPDETLGWAYLQAKVIKGVLTWNTPLGRVSVDRLRDHVKARVRYQHGRVAVTEEVTTNGYVAQTPVSLTQARLFTMDKTAQHQILILCLKAIRFADRTHTDSFGYTRKLLWQYPGQLSARNLGQQDVLPIDAQIRVKVHLRGEG